jgi:hypothetical protein
MTIRDLRSVLNQHAAQFVLWLYPKGSRSGREWKVGSLQGEPGHSLSICIAGPKTGVFHDFATGAGGRDLLDLYCKAKMVSISEGIRGCFEWLNDNGHTSESHRPIPVRESNQLKPSASDIYLPTESEALRVIAMADTLLSTPGLCGRVAKLRGWQEQTIIDLAHECYLGWESNLAFIYDTGVKIRSELGGQRRFWWLFGKPWLWRGAYLPMAETVYLCEGETDAISLLDTGVEEGGKTRVVAVPSASTFDATWAPLFVGKTVILVFDNDSAGISALQKVAALIGSYAASVNRLNWETLTHAA